MLQHLPNAITLSRIALIPAIGSSILCKNYTATIPLFAYCAATDFADGWLARKYKWSSKFGSVLDPMADKLLIGTLSGCLWMNGLLASTTVGIVLGRDLLLLGVGAAFALRNRGQQLEVKPFLSSKINTALQMMLLTAAFVEGLQTENQQQTTERSKHLQEIRKMTEKFVWFSTIWSGCSYALHYKKALKFK